MKIILCILISAFFYQNTSYSQSPVVIDSLFSILKLQKEDTSQVNTLCALAFQLRNSDPDTSIYFGNKALKLASHLKYKMGIAGAQLQLGNALMNQGKYIDALKYNNNAQHIYEQLLITEEFKNKDLVKKQKARTYNNIGIIHWYQGNYPVALQNHLTALGIRKEINDKMGIAASYNNIGLVFSDLGNYSAAIENYIAALPIHEEIKDKPSIAATYINIGNIYRNMERYSEALKNYNDALQINESLKDNKGVAYSIFSIGTINDDLGNNAEAMQNYKAALKIREEIGDNYGIAQCYNNIGLIYSHQKNYSLSLENLFASLKIKEDIGDNEGIAEAYNNIGNIYRFQKNYKKASQYLNKSLLLSNEIGSLENIKLVYLSLATLDSTQGNFNKSLEYYKLYIIMRDSLANNKITEKITQQQLQYEFDKKETIAKSEQQKKDAIVQQQLQNQKIIRNSFIVGSALLLLLIIVLINRNKLKRTVEMEQMRSRLSRDLHDDIGSTLSSINILSRTAQNNIQHYVDEKTKASLEKINERSQRLLDNMSDIIWNINPGNDTIEEVMSRMREYATTILEAKNIDYTFNFPKEKMECKLSMEVKNNMYLIFKEAVNNLSKYSGCTDANLSLTLDEKNIHIKIEDNGKGFNESEIPHKGGLRNMKYRAEEIRGTFNITTEMFKGTKILLSIPRYS